MNLINIPDKRWSKFKQELIPIIYLSILNIVGSFKLSPITMKLTSPWNTILATFMSIAGTIAIAYGFTFADTFAPYLNPELHHLDNIPYSATLKKIHRIGLIVAVHLVFLIFWYKDPYGMSTANHAAGYVIRLTSWLLFYRAMYSKPVEQ
jgi:hypothetical protein